jgi:hypothetical protein
MRAHPIAHEVKQHYRAGVRVHHYERGSGKAPRQVVIGSKNWGVHYRATVSGGGHHESFSVAAGSLPGAMTEGLSRATIAVKSILIKRR